MFKDKWSINYFVIENINALCLTYNKKLLFSKNTIFGGIMMVNMLGNILN